MPVSRSHTKRNAKRKQTRPVSGRQPLPAPAVQQESAEIPWVSPPRPLPSKIRPVGAQQRTPGVPVAVPNVVIQELGMRHGFGLHGTSYTMVPDPKLILMVALQEDVQDPGARARRGLLRADEVGLAGCPQGLAGKEVLLLRTPPRPGEYAYLARVRSVTGTAGDDLLYAPVDGPYSQDWGPFSEGDYSVTMVSDAKAIGAVKQALGI